MIPHLSDPPLLIAFGLAIVAFCLGLYDRGYRAGHRDGMKLCRTRVEQMQARTEQGFL